MHTHFIRLIVSVLVTALLGSQALAQTAAPKSDQAPVGVVRMNISWAPQWKQMIDDMAKANVQHVRFSLAPDFKTTLETIKYAQAKGMDILVAIVLCQPALYPKDAPAPKGNQAVPSPGRALSEVDLKRYDEILTRFIADLDQEDVSIAALEVGNEINWAAFNSDLPLLERGKGRVFGSLKELGPYAPKVLEGFHRYNAAVRLARKLLDESRLQRNTKLVSAGLVAPEPSDPWIKQSGATVLDPALVEVLYEQAKIAPLFNARGIHIYPNVSGSNAKTSIDSSVARAARMCSPNNEPCYVTEFGFTTENDLCGQDPRGAYFQEFVRAARQINTIKGMYVFTWDEGRFAVFRCNNNKPIQQLVTH